MRPQARKAIHNKRIVTAYTIFLIAILGGIIIGSLTWWNSPSRITNISPSQVSKIVVFDGHTGKMVTITNKTNIEHIIEDLNSVTAKKEKISLGYMGYFLKTTIYKVNGGVYKSFIINSSDSVRENSFFYNIISNRIDVNYIENLISKDTQ